MTTPDTITTAQVQAIFHALATATDKAQRVMRSVEDGEIHPVKASVKLNELLVKLYAKLGEEDA